MDLDRVEANVRRVQRPFDPLSKGFRPHTKTQKLASLVRMQLRAGDLGIDCQKILETEVSAAEDFDDIALCYNLVSAEKITCARVLAECGQISEVADNAEVVAALAAGMTGTSALLRALVECDRGIGRCGAQSPEPARDLARLIAKAKGLRFGGLMTYPRP